MINEDKNNEMNKNPFKEIIKSLYNNMKIKDIIVNNIDLLSRKTLCEMSELNYELIFELGIKELEELMSNNSENLNNICDNILNIVELFNEMIKKNKGKILSNEKNIFEEYISKFIFQEINKYNESENNKELKIKIKSKLRVLLKLLIYFCEIYYRNVLNVILFFFTLDNIPPNFIFEILIEICKYYSTESSQNFEDIVDKMLPFLNKVKKLKKRIIICQFFSYYCESIIQSLENKLKIKNFDNISQLLFTVYELIYPEWTKGNEKNLKPNSKVETMTSMLSNLYSIATNFTLMNKEDKTIENKYNDDVEDKNIYIIKCIIMISTLIPENNLGNIFDIIINLFKNNLIIGKNKQNELLCKSFYIFLEFNINKFKGRISNFIEFLLNYLFQIITNKNISVNAKEFEENFLQLKNEIIKIFILFLSNFCDITLNFLLFKIDSNIILEKITSIIILKTTLLHINIIEEKQNQKLITAILKASHENDFEFKCCLFELIFVIFKKKLIKQENIGNELISILIKEAQYDNNNNNNLVNDENYPFISNKNLVIEEAEFTLINILNKIDFEIVFPNVYPFIFTVFTNNIYDKSQYIICKMINLIFENALKKNNEIEEKLKENENNNENNNDKNSEVNFLSLKLDYQKYPLLPYAHNLLIKMMIVLSNPFLKINFLQEALQTLKNILNLIVHSDDILINSIINTEIIENYFSNNKNNFDYCDFYEMLTNIFEQILNVDNQDENDLKKQIQFISLCLQVVNDNIINYKNNNEIIGFLFGIEGIILSKINLTENIKNNLEKMFSMVHPEYKEGKFDENEKNIPSDVLRQGLCLSFGYSSKGKNIDIILDKIHSYFKSEIIEKKQKSLTSFFQIKNNKDDIPKQPLETLIKILGYIAKYINVKDLISRLEENFLFFIDKYYNKYQKNNNNIKLACLFTYEQIFKRLNEDKEFILTKRDNYLEKMINEFNKEKQISLFKEKTLNNISFLIMLNPVIPLENCKMIIGITFSIFNYFKNDENENLKNKIFNSIAFNLFSICSFDKYKNSPNSENIISNEKIDDKKNEFLTNYSIIGYDNMIDYSDKKEINNDDIKNYIFEKFVEKYLNIDFITNNEIQNNKNQELENKEYLKKILSISLEKFILLNSNSFKINDKQFENWVVNLTCILIYYFDGNNGMSSCIEKILKDSEIDISTIDFSNQDNFIITFPKIVIQIFDIEKIFELLNKLIYLSNSKIEKVSELSTYLMINIIKNSPNYYQNNISLNESSEKIQNIYLNKFYKNYLKKLEKTIKEEDSKITFRIKNLLKISYTISEINYDIILSYSLDKKTVSKTSNSLSLIISNLCEDKQLISKIISRITGIMNNSSPIIDEDKDLEENTPYYTICRSTILLGIILKSKTEEISNLLKLYFPQILCTILLRIGSTYSFKYNESLFLKKEDFPKNQFLFALRNLFYYFEDCDKILNNDISIYSKLLNENEYDEGLYDLMICYCKFSNFEEQKKMFDFLSEFTKRKYKGQRLICTICFSVFVNYSSILHIKKDYNGDTIRNWRNNLILSLLNMINDKDFLIRKMSLRGIGNLGKIYKECCDNIENILFKTLENKNIEIQNNDDLKENAKNELKDKIMSIFYPNENNDYHILETIINKIDDSSIIVIKESLKTLNNIIDLLSIDIVFQNFDILNKLKQNFDNSNDDIRALSFSVFGKIINLLVFTIHSQNQNNNQENLIEKFQSNLIDNIHSNLICFLLNFTDEKEIVSKNVKETLFKSLFLLLEEDYTPIYDEIKNQEKDNEIIYEKFLRKIIEIITDSYSQKVPNYISDCIEYGNSLVINVRAYSIFVLIEFYYICFKKNKVEIINNINKDGILQQFIKLLNDNEQKVRIKAMIALNIFNSK